MSHRYASELHPNPAPNALRVCEGCGCTDDDPCFEPGIGGPVPCHWVDGSAVCSACAQILAELPLVEIFSDYEADLEIRERRKAAGR